MHRNTWSDLWFSRLHPLYTETCHSPRETAEALLRQEMPEANVTLVSCQLPVLCADDAYEIVSTGPQSFEIRGGEKGLLYGVWKLLLSSAGGDALPTGTQSPRYPLRMINCWDNADGSVERGYAGRSLFFDGEKFCYDPARMHALGRFLSSVGLNVLCINNVNVRFPADQLIDTWLPELETLAAIFRVYGVRLMVSIDYAMPIRYGVPTADPLSDETAAWWKKQVAKVYQYVPDLAGFLVKADSENRPGPFTYGRNHAEGANMLADAMKPFGGVLVWRCFVYNCRQDWRDGKTDRPMAAYQHYYPFDGQFHDNVILQVKYGPFDFQVREPVSPLLLAMKHTGMALEVQLAQEYTGQQIDLFAMPPLWREIFDDMGSERVEAVAAVSNLGRDMNWTGHPFAAVNLFTWGLFAWDPDTDPATAIQQWVRLTYQLSVADEAKLTEILLNSRSVYEKYTAPLGIGWMVRPSTHYGPLPDGYEYDVWGTYHHADRNGVGIDRTEDGTGYLLQYPEEVQKKYRDPETCSDNLLLFFHRVNYDHVMSDGRTMIQRIYDDHFEGLEETRKMAAVLATVSLPEPDRAEAMERMDLQLKNAREWCDIINSFFYRFSGTPDAKGREIWL